MEWRRDVLHTRTIILSEHFEEHRSTSWYRPAMAYSLHSWVSLAKMQRARLDRIRGTGCVHNTERTELSTDPCGTPCSSLELPTRAAMSCKQPVQQTWLEPAELQAACSTDMTRTSWAASNLFNRHDSNQLSCKQPVQRTWLEPAEGRSRDAKMFFKTATTVWRYQ